MPLPAGFKVNGAKIGTGSQMPVPPRVKKIMRFLDKLPTSELLTSIEISIQLGCGVTGSFTNHPVLIDYREKVDNKLFWGNRKSIAQLRKQLAEPEETQNENR